MTAAIHEHPAQRIFLQMASTHARFASLACTLFVALSGCVNVQPAAPMSLVAITYGGVQSPFDKNRAGVGAANSMPIKIGTPYSITYPPTTVRECNSDMTACAVGVVLLKSQIVLQKADANGATVLVNVNYRLDRQQVVRDSNMAVSIAVPAEVPTLHGSDRLERVVTLSYGNRRRVSFAHGVDFDVCIAPGDKYMQPVNGQCRFDDVVEGRATRESIQAL